MSNKRSAGRDSPPQTRKKRQKNSSSLPQASSAPQQPAQSSRLLALPDELKLTILEYALAEEDRIQITTDLKLPSLFSTCRFFRYEAIPLWFFGGNEFAVSIRNCDITVMLKFLRIFNTLKKEKMSEPAAPAQRRLACSAEYFRTPNWTNLMVWCKAVWENELPSMPSYEDDSQFLGVVCAATQLAEQFRGMEWEECKKALETLRRCVGKFQKEWMD